jgi:4-hydroxyphenylpyruvate dioxygenase
LAGLKGIEAFYEDIKLPARAMPGNFEENLLKSATQFRELCDKCSLHIVTLQPFKNYEGLLSPQRRREKLEKLRIWIKRAKLLRTDIIQIPSLQLPRVMKTGLCRG